MARFNPDGALDASFGAGGRVSTEFFAPPLQGAQEFAGAVLVQPDGKIVVAGSARQGQNRFAPVQGAIARYSPDGTPDSGSGSGGKVLTAGNGPFTALGLDAEGGIFALPAPAEFSPHGQPDAMVTPAAITAGSTGGDAAFAPGGQFAVAGTAGVARHDTDIQLRRFTAGGTLASASAASGYSGAAGTGQARDGAGALLVQPDGKIVAAGFSENNTTGHVFIALARYNG